MSEERGPRAWESEKASINEAYHDHIKKIFEVFASSSYGHDDKEALARFKGAVEAVRRSHVLAISVFADHDKI